MDGAGSENVVWLCDAVMPGGMAAAVKAGRVHLDPGMAAAAAFARLLDEALRHIAANTAVVIDGRDPEGVHQWRVGLRRARVLIAVFRSLVPPARLDYLRQECKWLHRGLGPARDWDVFVNETLSVLEAEYPAFPGMALLRREAESARASGYLRAREIVRDPRADALFSSLGRLAQAFSVAAAEPHAARDSGTEKLTPFAARVLARKHKKLVVRRSEIERMAEDALHDLRIRAKKQRYTVEFFASLYRPKPVRAYLRRITAVQDALGALNDAVIARPLLERLDQSGPGATEADVAARREAIACICGWQAGRARLLRDGLPAALKELRKTEPFWAPRD